MSDVGKLCYKSGGNALCYKAGGSALIFKGSPGGETTIAMAWAADARDLDICAYWVGDSGNVAGYGYSFSGCTAPYQMTWSGDVTASDASETLRVKCAPWSTVTDANRRLRVHFNFYGYDAEDHPGSSCWVIASQINGPTKTKSGQSCSTNQGQKATTGDPYCDVVFDSNGTLLRID